MGGGQPYRRFKSAQEEKREAAKVDRVITVQRQKSDKPKYEMDMKKEVFRFKQAFKLAEKDKLPRSRLQVDLVHFFIQLNLCFIQEVPGKREERRRRKEEIDDRRRTVKNSLPLLFS